MVEFSGLHGSNTSASLPTGVFRCSIMLEREHLMIKSADYWGPQGARSSRARNMAILKKTRRALGDWPCDASRPGTAVSKD